MAIKALIQRINLTLPGDKWQCQAMKMKVINTIKWGLMEPKPTMQATYVREMTVTMLEQVSWLLRYTPLFHMGFWNTCVPQNWEHLDRASLSPPSPCGWLKDNNKRNATAHSSSLACTTMHSEMQHQAAFIWWKKPESTHLTGDHLWFCGGYLQLVYDQWVWQDSAYKYRTA